MRSLGATLDQRRVQFIPGAMVSTPFTSSSSSGSGTGTGGMPKWLLPVLLVGGGIGLFFYLKKRKRR